MAEPVTPNVSPSASPDRRALRAFRQRRKEARHFAKETGRLAHKHRKRLGPDKLAQIEQAVAAVDEAARGDDAGRLEGALKRLEGVNDKHLAFARLSPGVEYTLSIGKALLLALVLRLFVIEAFKIPSGSMIPSLLIGDHLFVNKLSYGVRLPVVDWLPLHWGGYERGEIIVFVNPNDDALPLLQRRDYIKRIIGLPGDTVEVRDEVVFVNGVAQMRDLVDPRFPYWERLGDNGPWVEEEGELYKETLLNPDGTVSIVHSVLRAPDRLHASYEGPFKVPPGHLFMMGDNRDNSADGRTDGGWFVPFDHVKGRALFVWLSWGKPGTWLWGDTGLRFERFFQGVH